MSHEDHGQLELEFPLYVLLASGGGPVNCDFHPEGTRDRHTVVFTSHMAATKFRDESDRTYEVFAIPTVHKFIEYLNMITSKTETHNVAFDPTGFDPTGFGQETMSSVPIADILQAYSG